jgi:hypothetical protein
MSRERQFMCQIAMLTDLAENKLLERLAVRGAIPRISDWRLAFDWHHRKDHFAVTDDEILTYDRQNRRSQRVSA